MTLSMSPQTEAKLAAIAQQEGVDPAMIVEKLISKYYPDAIGVKSVDPANDASIALLQSWLTSDATDDPEDIRAAEQDLTEFERNMNAPRREAGARLHFPEVEA